jgi:hypothetical protein
MPRVVRLLGLILALILVWFLIESRFRHLHALFLIRMLVHVPVCRGNLGLAALASLGDNLHRPLAGTIWLCITCKFVAADISSNE